MAKAASRTRTSPVVKNNPGTVGNIPTSVPDSSTTPEAEAKQASASIDRRQHVLTMTEEEGLQVYQARCMLKLLEDMAFDGEREITVSRGALAVMMAVIREKLAFGARLLPLEDDEIVEAQ